MQENMENNMNFKGFLLLAIGISILSWATGDAEQRVANTLDAFQQKFEEYKTKKSAIVRDICSLTYLKELAEDVENPNVGCRSEMSEEIDVRLRKFSKQSHSIFPEKYDSYDIVVEDNLGSFGRKSSLIEFYKDFNWDRYPDLLPVKETTGVEFGTGEKFGNWICQKEHWSNNVIICFTDDAAILVMNNRLALEVDTIDNILR